MRISSETKVKQESEKKFITDVELDISKFEIKGTKIPFLCLNKKNFYLCVILKEL